MQSGYLCTAECMWYATPVQNIRNSKALSRGMPLLARIQQPFRCPAANMLALRYSVRDRTTLTFELVGRRPRLQRYSDLLDARPQR